MMGYGGMREDGMGLGMVRYIGVRHGMLGWCVCLRVVVCGGSGSVFWRAGRAVC